MQDVGPPERGNDVYLLITMIRAGCQINVDEFTAYLLLVS
jgi:hypothetical protein